jgi:hypothetical protein
VSAVPASENEDAVRKLRASSTDERYKYIETAHLPRKARGSSLAATFALL